MLGCIGYCVTLGFCCLLGLNVMFDYGCLDSAVGFCILLHAATFDAVLFINLRLII